MKLYRLLTFLASWWIIVPGATAAPSIDPQTETLIEQLRLVSEIGYGYSRMFSGTQFLPVPSSSEVHTLILGSPGPTNSPVLEGIVRRGILAVPSLLNHLDDIRETKIPELSGMMWISFSDEYDYNRRTKENIPTGVNKDLGEMLGDKQPDGHKITVGDLCFVALGQIVNRNFNATRYQPTGGLIVNSPTYSKRLCEVTREEYHSLSEEKHRQLLTADFTRPDSEFRRNEACIRIGFYYPQMLEALVLEQLAVSTYDVFKIDSFVRDKLYGNQSAIQSKARFDDFVHVNGMTFSDGVLLRLFEDLNTQEADEQHHLFPPLDKKHDARALLILLYGYPDSVNSKNVPYVTTWDTTAQARFIETLILDHSPKIDKAVHNVFIKLTDDDYLALPCIKRLMHKGYDEELRLYCIRRIPKSEHYADRLKQSLADINAK